MDHLFRFVPLKQNAKLAMKGTTSELSAAGLNLRRRSSGMNEPVSKLSGEGKEACFDAGQA